MTDKKAAAGWYPDPKRPGELRRWDGAAWADEWKPGQSYSDNPGAFLVWGIFLVFVAGLFGGLLVALEQEDVALIVAVVVGSAASVVLSIGMVAKGVEVGVRAAKR